MPLFAQEVVWAPRMAASARLKYPAEVTQVTGGRLSVHADNPMLIAVCFAHRAAAIGDVERSLARAHSSQTASEAAAAASAAASSKYVAASEASIFTEYDIEEHLADDDDDGKPFISQHHSIAAYGDAVAM